MENSVQNLGEELLRRREARKHLIPFITYTKPDFEVYRHHRYVAEYAEAVLRGDIKRLIVNEPPRHSKSEIFTRRLPAFFLGRFPNKFVISASYNSELATDFGRDVRGIVSSTEFRTLFPAVELRADSRAADRWNTIQGGAYFAAGVGSGVTGRGMHLGIVDDPFKGQEDAESSSYKEKLWKWWKTDFKTRMMPDAAIIIAKTRWTKDGLVGRILDAEGPKWTVINLPALAVDPDPLGRAEDEPLWPEWFNREALEDMMHGMSLREWSALYQGKPIPEGGNIFKATTFRRYKELPSIEAVILSLDTAWETKDSSSYSVILAWGVGPDGYYLLGFWRDKVEYPDLKTALTVMGLKWLPLAVVIENKASGIALIQELERTSRWPVVRITSGKDKSTRARASTPLFQAGRVFFPELAPWTELVEAELLDFPGGKHDDIVDALVHGLTYLQENFTYTGLSTVPGTGQVEMNWDVYNYRGPETQVERDWDVYGRRLHG